MAAPDPDNQRVLRLSKLFNDVLYGRKLLNSSRDGKLFLESIFVQTDRATCVHRVLASTDGLGALQASMRFDTSPAFLNGHALRLLDVLQAPELTAIDSGSVLSKILIGIVEPAFFWDAFTKAFVESVLSLDAAKKYAWLLLNLVRLPGTGSSAYVQLAESAILDLILNYNDGDIRILGEKIKHSLPLSDTDLHIDAEAKPGGRHGNDHVDYREITIMPTADELLSQDRPFFRTANFIDNPELVSTVHRLHVDNQFRLLREDMLGEIREEMKVMMGSRKGWHKGLTVEGLKLCGIEMGIDKKRSPWGLKFLVDDGLPNMRKVDGSKRRAFLTENRQVLRQGNMACLFIDGEPSAFPTISRNEDELARVPAILTIQFQDDETLSRTLLRLKTANNVKLVQLDSAIFAYEPFLRRLQEMTELPLAAELLHWREGRSIGEPHFKPLHILGKLENMRGKELNQVLGTKTSVILDDSQSSSLSACFSQSVSMVQGPPGTGKSFIGALVAKVLHDSTDQVILVVCFTNHALDQFLEDLMKIGIPSANMVRLGGKSTDLTKPLMLREQTSIKRSATQWAQINKLKQKLQAHEERLRNTFNRYKTTNASARDLMNYLEFLGEDLPFFEAFTVSDERDGMTRVGKKNKAVDHFYLLNRWARYQTDAGLFEHLQPEDAEGIWNMTPQLREACMMRWRQAILNDLVTEMQETGRAYNVDQSEMARVLTENDTAIIKSKKIIACTTNGAATHASAIQAASPGIVLVEEAGEILEAHILTSLGPDTQQLILIGDHQQLRPKCSYELSVEQGDGFDLNRSLFERLILKGYPHVTLTKQHRMRPEISAMVRHLTYPDLIDAESTRKRANLRGFRDNVIFIDHRELEVELKNAKEMRDGKTSSKENHFEAQMILKCVRYLAQQGYGSDKIVVITPYLGQLKLLRDQLARENDPILNDIDKFDLLRAGILTDLGSKTSKPSLRISTIDNYQGEESDIILVSLTRSNNAHDIGFMAAPERLNVLLSRARDALIMIGNSETFINARKGKEVWRKLFDLLKENGHVYEGFPVKCEKHPDRVALLCTPDAFESESPDGGCKEHCGVLLHCKLHKCPSNCHQVFDHSKMECHTVMKQKCPQSHSQTWKCFQGAPKTCHTCENERKAAEKKARKLLEDQLRRDDKKQKHQKDMLKLEEEIERLTQGMKDANMNTALEAVLSQKRKDLEDAQKRAKDAANKPKQAVKPNSSRPTGQGLYSSASGESDQANSGHQQQGQTKKTKPASSSSKPPASTLKGHQKLCTYITSAVDHNKSPSKTEWQRQKDQENAVDPAIDSIMEMIGLEEVKSQILRIKAKVETSIRQGTDLTKERLGLVLLGNPGTVARHYAKVLTSLQVLSGDGFVETTGSRLAHGGIKEAKDHLKQLENSGGGVYFIDEAYQLAEPHNHGGRTVLEFLLAEIENLVGHTIFVFAGYRKQMEKFFESNPGLSSRIPYMMHFEDYTDAELLKMLQFNMNKFYKGKMAIEDGLDGLYMKIAVGRLGKGRGRDGFGNARALENVFARIRERQAERLSNERRDGLGPDDFFMAKEDLIGPDPSKAMKNCHAWTDLKNLTGLKSVKESVDFMIDLIKTNYHREVQEKPIIEVSLNRVFLGSPGTGKTSVAKIYGKILADIGLLSNGEVVTKNPSDFVGNVIGQSEANTKAILATTAGKVLIIDEAYMLYPGNSGGGQGTDIFKTAVIDTLVAEIQSTLGEDRCVLLLGYEDQMIDMFQNVNPGLTRRFPLTDAFRFEDFSDSELQEILEIKIKGQGLAATTHAKSVAIDVLSRARNGLNFGNGGDVESLISKAKRNYQARQSALPATERSFDFNFEPVDFDLDFNRAVAAGTNLKELFQGVIGCDAIVTKLDGFLKVAKGMRAQDLDPRGQIPMNFIFKGPPGTGQYVGQTGPKTLKQLEKGLGKVLFVDEAYRLGEGLFATEAINELVDLVTKPKFAGKMIIILAGYEDDMNKLLRVNEGLSSRFADEVYFPALTPADCLHLLDSKLIESRIAFPELQDPTVFNFLHDLIEQMSKIPGWGNARDLQTLAKSMVRAVYSANQAKVAQLEIHPDIAIRCTEHMLADKLARNKSLRTRPVNLSPATQSSNPDQGPPPNIGTGTGSSASNSSTKAAIPDGEANDKPLSPPDTPSTVSPVSNNRDPGVSDETWAELEQDKRLAKLAAEKYEQEILEAKQALRLANIAQKAAEVAMIEHQRLLAKNEAAANELLKRREEARIREVEARALAERLRKTLELKIELEKSKRKMEEQVQVKLRQMGVCIMGYRWIKQAGGYRCAGGSHYVSDGQLGI
ncbi:related to stage V sporulation protein K [Rhynchosporium graminicola]|uniref:Related to stage V sporulation protein K n=1 Tax=Rhynchosporium graminicola TaxID=2792576 RepID=A0A1E1L9Z7_9HELO|nr:related to stage V sporulation protein K [Rhynchosporium commune]